MGDLPPALKMAAAAMLEGIPRASLAEQTAALSVHYRAGGSSAGAVSNSSAVLAYVTSRLPATFAATAAAMEQTALAAPSFSPRRVVDVGAGPGTASWAAVEVWPAIEQVTMIDGNQHFMRAASDLSARSTHPAIVKSVRVLADAAAMDTLPQGDLIVAAYTLAEIAGREIARLVDALWESCNGVLLLIEPGTPAGSERIRAARGRLIEAGATVAAPCPHALACPIVAPDWCHFSERLARSRDHRLAKSADAPFEDERFSYVALARPRVGLSPLRARVLAPPKVSKAERRLKLCTPEGVIAGRRVAARDKHATARVRRLRWGDTLPDGV